MFDVAYELEPLDLYLEAGLSSECGFVRIG
jgi:hypothetical protein